MKKNPPLIVKKLKTQIGMKHKPKLRQKIKNQNVTKIKTHNLQLNSNNPITQLNASCSFSLMIAELSQIAKIYNTQGEGDLQ